MSLVNKFIGSIRPTNEKTKNPLTKYFLNLENTPDFPFTLALHALENLESTTNKKDEFYQYLLEDIIFSSIYATFYETILTTIKDNPTLAIGLINNFEKSAEERERLIGEQTEYHVNFIINKGLCPGCPACDNHTDVAELLKHWQRGDIDFFIQLYIGMQTIQFTMENLLYDVLPTNLSLINDISNQNILELRKYVYSYAEAHLK